MSLRPSRARGSLAAAIPLAFGWSCAEPPRPLPLESLSLHEIASSARAVVETDTIDIGAPESRGALWSGWGPNQPYSDGNFVWGVGKRSLVRFEVIEPRNRVARLRGWSYSDGDASSQEVRFSLGDREIARRELGAQPETIELELPHDALRVGENVLEIAYERHEKGGWLLAAGWDTVRFDGARPKTVPRIERGDDEIVVPSRSGVEWAVELPGGSWLAWESAQATGSARLAVSIADEDDQREVRPDRGANRLRLTEDAEPHRLHTISLRALGASGEIRLTKLRIHAHALDASAVKPAAARAAVEPASTPAGGKPPNLILYIVDTLRADHLSCYGYRRSTSPALDRFARERAVLFREARAQSSWTRPAIASLLTGLHPITHGAQLSDEKLSARVETVAERLQAAGWQTAMITTNGNVSRRWGFGQGFDRFTHLKERLSRPETHARSLEAQKSALEWLDQRDPNRPFFLVVHTSDPHDPYTPAARFRRQFASDVTDPRIGSRDAMSELWGLKPEGAAAMRAPLIDLYDGEIAENDESFGRFVADLAQRGLDRESALVFTADHGEEFHEHGGWTHGRTLYEEQLRIPLLLALPDRRGAGTAVAEPVEQIDVTPTLLGLAGLRRPAELPGLDLRAVIGDGVAQGSATSARTPGRVSYAWLSARGLDLASVVRSQWKLIDNRLAGDPMRTPPCELFRLDSDPEERSNLALGQRLQRSWLLGHLAFAARELGSLEASERAEVDPELRATLKALGYL